MKKILTNLFFLFVLITIITISFSACKEDTDCNVEIITKLYNDTNMLVPYAVVTIEEGDIKVVGVSDINGKYAHTFPLEAILKVTSEDTISVPPLVGEGSIRLVPGKTIKKTIFVK